MRRRIDAQMPDVNRAPFRQDDEALAKAQAGDAAAFGDLVRQYQALVFSVALRVLGNRTAAEDVAQAVLTGEPHTARARSLVGWRRLAAVAACALIFAGGSRYYAYRATVAEAERVTREIAVALEITSEKLGIVQRMVQPAER